MQSISSAPISNYQPDWLFPSILKQAQNESATSKSFREGWKQAFTLYQKDKKREHLIRTIEELKSNMSLSSLQFRECCRTLEDIALSPRVSDLNRQDYYTRVVDGRNSHPHSLKGIACFLKCRYPEEQFFFAFHLCRDSLTCLEPAEIMKLRLKPSNSSRVTDIRFEHIVKAAEVKPVFLIYQYSETLHKMLVILQKESHGYILSLFDSLGINPWNRIKGDEPYHWQMNELVQKFAERCGGSSMTVRALGTTRQKDAVNCGSFVIFDFELAFKFMQERTPLFEDKATPHAAFMEISQQDQDVESQNSAMQRYKSIKESDKMVNLKASMLGLDILKFFFEERITYPQDNARFEEESEEDEEGCVIS